MAVLDALQVNDAGPFSTPVDWRRGDKVIVAPSISTEEATERFADVVEVKPYLRYAQPTSA